MGEVLIQVVPQNVATIQISYKNKDDLFKQYKKWIKSLNLPSNEVYWCDSEGDHTGIRNADDLLGAAHNFLCVKLFTPLDEKCDSASSSDYSEIESDRGRSREKKRTTNSR
ncbi:unnamed protein product [Strongylus vulgaris]|uniref:PB1 domain-containing protein n=1 Tax=Strongylus vulgaris TaxID=40348 RepID=A0A3P7IZN4_STRVU|nr:unnamed protein product [Strongylus vulgaris]